MKREELLRSKGYWIAQLQIKLFETVKNYLNENNLTQSQFADEVGVSKSYITQVLNGDFDHKISKYVDLMLSCNKVPIVTAMDIDEYIGDDICGMKGTYNSIVLKIPLNIKHENMSPFNEIVKTYPYSLKNENVVAI